VKCRLQSIIGSVLRLSSQAWSLLLAKEVVDDLVSESLYFLFFLSMGSIIGQSMLLIYGVSQNYHWTVDLNLQSNYKAFFALPHS
jgi:hypothetical protein